MNPEPPGNSAFTKVHFVFDNLPCLSSLRRQLDLRAVAIGLIKLPPDEDYTLTRSYAKPEKVYIVIEGQGLMLVKAASSCYLIDDGIPN